jgi:hypothetical protein
MGAVLYCTVGVRVVTSTSKRTPPSGPVRPNRPTNTSLMIPCAMATKRSAPCFKAWEETDYDVSVEFVE